MVIATIRIVLSLPGNSSLKGKRKVVRRIVDRAKHRFNASVAEVASLDDHRRAVIGACVVSNDGSHATAQVDKLAEMIAGASEAIVADRRTELVQLGDGDEAVGDWSEGAQGWGEINERFGR